MAVYLLLVPLSFQPASPEDPSLIEYARTVLEERPGSRLDRAWLAQISAYDLVVFRFGFRPASPSPWTLLTSMFLHGGLVHLLGNMLFLWIYGDNVEHRLGRLPFLAAYLGTGLAASVGDGLLRMGSGIPSVGASGAISGVLGLYFLWFPHNRVRVWIFLFPFIAQVVEMRARIVLGIYLLFDNLLPLALTTGRAGVSYGAHLGGFVAGAAAAFLLDRLSQARPEPDVRRRGVAPGPAADAGEALRESLASGRWDLAAEWFFRAPHSLTRAAVSASEKIRLGAALEQNHHPRAALAAYQRALADHPRAPERAEAHLGAARVLLGPLRNPTGAYQHLYSALEADPTPEQRSRVRELLSELSGEVRHIPGTRPR